MEYKHYFFVFENGLNEESEKDFYFEKDDFSALNDKFGIKEESDFYGVKKFEKRRDGTMVKKDVLKIGISSKNQNSKNEGVEKMEKVILENGVTYHGVLDVNDIGEAQRILEDGRRTKYIDAADAYMERVPNDFCGTYSMKVDREDDFNRFIYSLNSDVRSCQKREEIQEKWSEFYRTIRREYNSDRLPYRQYCDWDVIMDKLSYDEREAHDTKCKKCSFRLPSIQEWKSNTYEKKGNTMKLTKALSKAGFAQEIIDSYTASDKTEKDIFVTISGNAQFVAGMTYYRKDCAWNSCQNPANNEFYSQRLAGALYDDKLLIVMLHENIEDVHDMENKLMGRTCARIVEVDGKNILVGTKYYGDNMGRSFVGKAMEKLFAFDIFSNEVIDGGGEQMTEAATGHYHIEYEIEEEIYIDRTYTVSVECPVCDGDGEYSFRDEDDYWQEVTCPHCQGEGSIEREEEVYIHETVVVDSEEKSVVPYDEFYEHCGDYITIELNLNIIRDKRQEVINVLDEDGEVIGQIGVRKAEPRNKKEVLERVAELEEEYFISQYTK